MHSTTLKDLGCLSKWTRDVARADRFIVALDAVLPKREDTGPYASIETSFGSVTLSIYQAPSMDTSVPFLLAVRRAGFRRVDGPIEEPLQNRVIWNYEVKDEQGEAVTLRVAMHFLSKDSDESAGCRYVTVGEKTVPDTRLLCGAELAAWEAEHADA